MGNTNNTLRIVASVLLIAAFFLPWFKVDVLFASASVSAFDTVKAFFQAMGEVSISDMPAGTAVNAICMALIPVFALIILVLSVNNRLPSAFLRMMPLILTLVIFGWMLYENNKNEGSSMGDLFKVLGIGFYLTLAGAIVLSFLGRSASTVRTA